MKTRQVEVGKRLQRARHAARLSLADAAAAVGRTKQAVHAWERGRALPPALHLGDLALLYGVSADALLFEQAQIRPGDAMARKMAGVPPALRGRWLLLWQVFMRDGAPDMPGVAR
jgi:transcriptional regulator with XRE-family HTH domain